MMRLALDSNRYGDAVAGDPYLVRLIASADEVLLPFVVVGELRYGFLHGTKAPENERQLRRFLAAPRVSLLFADDATTYFYAQASLHLRRQGTPIPANDIWIAALVIQHGLHLCSRDRHFDHLPHLPRA